MYITDLHGRIPKYNYIIQYLENRNDIDLLICGADILPNTPPMIQNQHEFIIHYLPRFFEKINIPIFIDFYC